MTNGVDIQKEKIRNLISGIYDIQKLRIATGNRIVQSFNIQMGQAPSTRQEDLEEDTKKLLDQLREEYKKITDAYVNKYYTLEQKDKNSEVVTVTLTKNASVEKIIEKMNADDKSGIRNIKSKLDYDLMRSYAELCNSEDTQVKVLEKEVKAHYLWDKFFADVKGCGVLMAAVCLGYLDVHKARHVSSFWKYAGLDTVAVVKDDGQVIREGRARKHASITEVEYTDKDGNVQTKKGLGYNPIVKTKLVGVLADCMIKAGLRSEKGADGKAKVDEDGNKIRYALPDAKYVEIYLDYLSRLNQRPDTKELTDMHKHRMAVRYMIKQFLRDLWVLWRTAEGYEISEPYEVAKLGMKPHKYNEAHYRMAQAQKAV